ncbi:uncharacterized protein PG998_011595 [Apiospora kogelbergensis]|uniref:uncharacterized protein n=1 Tax=Apiospora kogelbergensis TaxID=1337665 RepID=UPI00313124AC
MADPLSIAASIAGLASLAGTVFMTLNNYRVSVRDARTEVATFATELRNLSGMLQNLSLLAGTLPLSEGKTMSLDKSQISEMEEMIGTVDKKISKATKDFQAKKQKALRWHFSKEEVDKLLDQIRAYKSTINLALSADTLERLNDCLKVHKKLEASIMSSQKALKLLQDTQDRVRMDKKKQKTFDYFLKVNPQPFLQTSLRLREETTGEWLVRDPMVAQWMSIPSSKLWLSGIPGAGKTVLCGLLIASILENLQSGMAFAFFFCDYKESATQYLPNIFSSIALQLALQKDEAFDRLQAYYGQLHPKNGLPREVEPDQLMELIQDMSRLFDRTYIVIDALDECEANTRGVARGLVSVANNSHSLSVALFSREVIDISDELEAQFPKLEIAARNEDLERYISGQMMMRTSLSKLDAEESREIREKLLGKAHGMFRWVACQLDSLEDIGRMARKTALEELPPTLNRTYDRILEKRRGNVISREIVRRTLHWICYDKALSIEVLRQALTVSLARDRIVPDNSEVIGEDEISRYCSSLIRKSQNGLHLEIAHFTVEEYLRTGIPSGSELASFQYSTSGTSQSMTKLSLWYILQPSFGYQPFANEEYEGKIRDRAGTHPFYLHASTFWPLQTECHDDPDVSELLRVLFGPQSRAQFHNWLIQFLLHTSKSPDLFGLGNASVQDVTKLATHQDVTPLHVAASLSISALCDWLLQSETCLIPTEALSISLLDCTLFGPCVFHLYNGLRFRDLLPGILSDEINKFLTMQKSDSCFRSGTRLKDTLTLLQRKARIGSFLEKRRTGPLAIHASVLYQDETIFLRLLDNSPEDYLTRGTVEAIKLQFHHGKPSQVALSITSSRGYWTEQHPQKRTPRSVKQ